MSTFPGSPRTVPGAVVAVEPLGALSRVAVFQYNPDQVRRTLRRRTPEGRTGSSDRDRIWGAPTQRISLRIELDAADEMEVGNPASSPSGVAAGLAVLEMLLYPAVASVVANVALLAAGTIEVVPPRARLAVLAWGPGLVVPVTVQELDVTEETFDPTTLLPTRATAELTLDVLTYDDLAPTDPGFAVFLAHQVAKEALATLGGAHGVAALAGGA
ncbi:MULTISPECIES: hypothetical protein [unclassified Isoptericola]|uniref:hypothetical protein n=1 Tax=unclassified Isoptericola TaxID=2623355 RepID=UPI002712E138|nr:MULTISPECIES: hypothetical protein [unclassified Isoptericola]MDO8144898.1 hypothetical protein [Isoptericola sp. 178]MDO8149677.1 hypothetical protein [Isoptericola sp. b515]MDO8152612.1 hypothetical protein [Isoptericola sp. b408]